MQISHSCIQQVHTWAKVFSDDCKTVIREFNKLPRHRKIAVIATTVLATLALSYVGWIASLGSVAVFRFTAKLLKVSHPAEKPAQLDIISFLPPEQIVYILGTCDALTFRNFEATCKTIYALSDGFWKLRATKLLENSAALLYKTRLSWKSVICDINKPLPLGLKLETTAYQNYILDEDLKIQLEEVIKLAASKDFTAFKNALDALILMPNYEYEHYLLGNNILGTRPIVAAASKGYIQNVKLLCDVGTRDIHASFFHPEKNLDTLCPLYAAAVHKQVKILKFLLTKGFSFPSYGVRGILGHETFLKNFFMYLINAYAKSDTIHNRFDNDEACVECLLLLLKAAQEQYPEEYSHSILPACEQWVFIYGSSTLAHLFYALGATFADHTFVPTVKNMTLPMIQFCHEKSIINFVKWRGKERETILHHCVNFNLPHLLAYFISIGVPEKALLD